MTEEVRKQVQLRQTHEPVHTDLPGNQRQRVGFQGGQDALSG